MLFSFVLRLRPDGLDSGQLVGELEDVETGTVYPLSDTADLVRCCQRIRGGMATDEKGQR